MSEFLKYSGQITIAVAIIVAIIALVRDQRRKQLIDIQGQLYNAQKEATVVSEKKREEEHKECEIEKTELRAKLAILESDWKKVLSDGVIDSVDVYLKDHLEEDKS